MDDIKNKNTDTIVADTTPAERTADAAMMEEMAKAGVLFGRKRTRTNPRMKKYIFTTRNGMEIFDLTQTIDLIARAQEFIKEVVKTGRPILLVGTEPSSIEAVKALGEKFMFPFVVERWLGGTLTNFESLSKRLNYYMGLKADKETGKLDKYTKKERVVIEKQIERLTRLFGGLERLTQLPGAVIVFGSDAHEIAVAEANRMKIPLVAIANSSANPDTLNYIIPANDNSRSSITWIAGKIGEAIEAGIREKHIAAEAGKAASAPVAAKVHPPSAAPEATRAMADKPIKK
ncbi:MAG: 30S ribosomal protein S2 [bacterium]|nr:30S ribosomal protein S2 [bacterium]